MCSGSGGHNWIVSCSVWHLRCQSKLELIDLPNPNLLTKLLHELCECVHAFEKFDSFDGMGDGTLRLGLRQCPVFSGLQAATFPHALNYVV